MNITDDKLIRMIKYLGMLGSNSDNEICMAGKKATALLKDMGVSWEELMQALYEPAPTATVSVGGNPVNGAQASVGPTVPGWRRRNNSRFGRPTVMTHDRDGNAIPAGLHVAIAKDLLANYQHVLRTGGKPSSDEVIFCKSQEISQHDHPTVAQYAWLYDIAMRAGVTMPPKY